MIIGNENLKRLFPEFEDCIKENVYNCSVKFKILRIMEKTKTYKRRTREEVVAWLQRARERKQAWEEQTQLELKAMAEQAQRARMKS